jgi:hypothetical protein
VHIFPSSPPAAIQSEVSFEKLDNMDVKSELPATQHGETSKPPLRRVSSTETDRPPSAQQLRQVDECHADESDEEHEEDPDSDPAEKIVDFDWNDLHRRYHDAMKGCHEQEGELTQEWESLMKVRNHFPVDCWHADMDTVLPHLGRIRSRPRDGSNIQTVPHPLRATRYNSLNLSSLKTRTTYVQNSEEALEKRRNHCMLHLL